MQLEYKLTFTIFSCLFLGWMTELSGQIGMPDSQKGDNTVAEKVEVKSVMSIVQIMTRVVEAMA